MDVGAYAVFIVLWLLCGLVGVMVKVPRMGQSIAESHGWDAVKQFLTALFLMCFGLLLFFFPKEK